MGNPEEVAATEDSAAKRAAEPTDALPSPPAPAAGAGAGPAGSVFVSHSSRNAEAAGLIVGALEAAGVPCWVAPRDIPAGADWNHSIMTGINGCRAMLLVFTRHSNESDPVKREVERALNRRVPVIPVRLEQVPPSPALEYMISTSQWVDAYPPPVDRHLDAVVGAVKRALDLAHTAPRPDPSAPPKDVGPYRILEPLGEGGMGTVYKAEQRSPVKRTVAVKVIKPGFDSREVIARFESERQALARMDHPNVARVLDAGADSFGRPYFVMEYVPGVPITKYADDNKLSVRDRLELFTQACDAISHAHTKALIHRDIKASNVLAYTADGGRPAVKVIDFGIAKALTGDKLTDRTFNTEQGQAIGTYESMSPEQADGSPDIDTRTDVYSLGVLLYELLAGAKPFDKESLAKAADAEVRRIIREVEPPRPSTRLSSLRGEAATKAAAARQGQLESLARQLRSELEWIPLKAMRKERARRYASPRELAEDVSRYLAGEALVAGPESRAYRFKKFARRNRAALAVAAAFALLVTGGVAAYIHGVRAEQHRTDLALTETRAQRAEAEKQKRTADQQRDEARRQKTEADRQREEVERQKEKVTAEKAEAQKQEKIASAVNEFLSNMLRSADPNAMLGDKVTVVQVIRSAVRQLDRGDGAMEPLTEAAVRYSIGRTLVSLGRFEEAEPNLRKALELRRKALPAGHPDIATSMDNLAVLLAEQGRPEEAENLGREALDIQRKALPAAHPDIATSLNNLALALDDQGRPEEAEKLYREALEIDRKARPAGDTGIAMCMNNLARLLVKQNRPVEAEELCREALDIRRKTLPVGHPDVAKSLNNLATLLVWQGRPAEAEELYREALELARKALPAGHPNIAAGMDNLAELLARQGRPEEAAQLYREALDVRRKSLPAGHPDVATTLANLAPLLMKAGRAPEAEPLFREFLMISRDSPAPNALDVADACSGLGRCLSSQGKYAEAEPLLREAMKVRQKELGLEQAVTGVTATALAELLDRTGRGDEATTLRKVRAAATAATRPADPKPASTRPG